MSKIESLLESPEQLARELPATTGILERINAGRRELNDIFDGRDKRLLMLVGPCSIHNPEAAMEYASRLAALAREVEDDVKIVMRAYFEKPRTTLGWKGLIYDPELNGEYDIAKGMSLARQLLLDIAGLKLGAATELLDPTTSSYLAELVCWAGIGARTSESPTHRQLASGLDMPVGFKNSTDGNLQVAIDAICAAAAPHSFIGVLSNGHSGIMRTSGNSYGHLVLRGGAGGENYYPGSVNTAIQKLARAGLRQNVLIDCSHGNSRRDPSRQRLVLDNVLQQRLDGNELITGVMLESYLKAGSQQLLPGEPPAPDISITDGCIGWEESRELVLKVAAQLRHRRISQAVHTPASRPAQVAYLGPAATFTHIAAQKIFHAGAEYIPCGSIGAVFKSVESGECDYGCVPVENSSEGIVNATLDTLVDSPLKIYRESAMEIHQCLLSNVPKDQIKLIYSHAQSLGQCRRYIERNFPDAETITVASNARAAELAVRSPYAAVIGSAEAAELYRLKIAERNIEDARSNITRFFILARRENRIEKRNKCCLCFTARDKVGALYDSLRPFKERDISLSMIESRPTGARQWQYRFFVDVLGTPEDAHVAEAIGELRQSSDDLKIIGSFPAE